MRDTEAMQSEYSSGNVGTETDFGVDFSMYFLFPETFKAECATYKAIQSHHTRRASREICGTSISKEFGTSFFCVSRMCING